MSRPHICFMQAQCLPWTEPQDEIAWLWAAGLQSKTLSVDAADGSRTMLLQLPPGFDREFVLTGDSYLEVLMLQGAAGSVTGKPLSPGIASKILHRDAVTAEQSFLYCAMPQHPPPSIMVGKFTHPVVEEIFVLSGSYVFGDVGRMVAGGYSFWREREWHGPAGSETGYCLFIRVLGGQLSNQFSEEPAPFSWRPPYRPALPESLRSLAREVEEFRA